MKRLLTFTTLILTVLLASAVFGVQVSGARQNAATPTPGPDGRILYTVQEGDSCLQIQLITGIPIAQLRSLNRLDENCTLRTGQQLLIGMGGPAGGSATPDSPQSTATPGLPSPTPNLGEANVCILLYDDVNGDALRQEGEVTIPNGAVSVIGTSGQYSQTANTLTGADPVCFEKVTQGMYNISAAAPEGYNPTTDLNYTLEIKAGSQVYVDFGAQQAGPSKPQDPANEPGSSNLLGIAGITLVLAGVGLAIYAWLVYGRRPAFGVRKTPYN